MEKYSITCKTDSGSPCFLFFSFNNNDKIDLDNLRIQFYKNMIDENERKKLYKLEQEVLEKGIDFYNEIVKGNKNDY